MNKVSPNGLGKTDRYITTKPPKKSQQNTKSSNCDHDSCNCCQIWRQLCSPLNALKRVVEIKPQMTVESTSFGRTHLNPHEYKIVGSAELNQIIDGWIWLKARDTAGILLAKLLHKTMTSVALSYLALNQVVAVQYRQTQDDFLELNYGDLGQIFFGGR